MAHTIIYNSETHIVETKVQGKVTLKEMKEIFSEAIQIGIANDHFLFLSDFREATISLSTLEIYRLPEILSAIAAPLGVKAYKLKRAIVTATASDDFRFAEVTTVNRGQTVKFFREVDEATNWLLEE